MTKLIKKYILFSLLLITSLSVSIIGKYESNIYPIAGYSEDFGVIYGGYYFVDLPSGGKAGTGAMNSDSGYRIWSDFDRLELSEKWELDGSLKLKDWEEFYYGEGNNTSGDDEKKLFQNLGSLSLTFRTMIADKQSIGINIGYETRKENISKQDNIKYFDAFSHIQTGLSYQFDTRDKTSNSTEGFFISPALNYYPKFTNTAKKAEDILKLSVDLRYFHPYKKGVFALKTYMGQLIGDNPNYLQTFKLGSSSLLRGAHTNRYNGKALTSFQAEYRFPVYKFISGSLFIDAAQTGKTISVANLHISKGFGFHLKVGKGNASLRFNKGYGEDNDKFYVGFNHAF